jgi:hypothetical protein
MFGIGIGFGVIGKLVAVSAGGTTSVRLIRRWVLFFLPHRKWGPSDSIGLLRCYYGADLLQCLL